MGGARAVTRIIAGRFGGRRLSTPSGRDTRPTSDRVREALFNALAARVDLEGARFADLYAGSGAVGLEALSRGASAVLLVESDAKAAKTARDNIAALGARGAVTVTVDRVARALAAPPPGDEPFDVVFADPPYALPESELTAALTALVTNGWLADDGVIAVERSSRGEPVGWVPRITADGVRRYGETSLWYGRRS